MTSYQYYLIESDYTEGIQDARSGVTGFLPPDLEQLFILWPRFWKEESKAQYLQPQDLIDAKSHTFKTKVFKHPNICQVCKEVIWNEGRTCRVCKIACHRKCEYKVSTACQPSVNYSLPSNGNHRSEQSPVKSRSVFSDSNQNKMMAQVHAEMSVQPSGGDSYIRYSFDLDVDYITERLIAVSFPAGGLEAQYRSNLRDVVRMLKSKHQDNYVILNLSQKRHDINQLNPQVYDLGWPDHLAPSLEKLCSICKYIETWLKADPHHVVALHCKGGRGPIGVVVLAYMNYINITSSSETVMDRYAMKRFLEAKTESAMQPSQHRYVNYFTGLLMKSIQVNSVPLFLHYVLIHGVPNYDINGGCRPFLRVYQGMQSIFTSGVYSVPEGTSRFAVTIDPALPLRGDILVKCYHKKFRATTRDVIFRCQFHTTAIMECRLIYEKNDLDDACTDARFPDFTKVEFVFSHTPDQLHGSDYVQGSDFPVDSTNDSLIRWDSYENFDKIVEGGDYSPEANELSVSMNNNIPHSSAPDGSLYAEVQKTPSPVQQDHPFFSSPNQAAPISPVPNQLMPIMPNSLEYESGPRSPMQTTQMAVLRAKMNAQMDPGYQTSKRRTPSPRTPTSDPPSPVQPQTPSVQFANGPQRPSELLNGPQSTEASSAQKRAMNYKEKRDLDDLLRGIGEDVPDISSPDSVTSGQEVAEERKIVDVQAKMSKLPPMDPGHSSTPKGHHPQPRNIQREIENPYAEITDAVPKTDKSSHYQANELDHPVEEQISRSHIETVESVRMPDLENQRTLQLHDNPTYAVAKENDQYLPPHVILRTQGEIEVGNGIPLGQQVNAPTAYPSGVQQPDIWQPQPLRAKKEQLLFIYKEDPTSPRGPTVSPSAESNAPKQPDQAEPSNGYSATTKPAEIGDDVMTWLQRQQQKLKEKRKREGTVFHPTFETPQREPPKVPESRQGQSSLPSTDKAPEGTIQAQEQTAREEMPADNLSWLEQKQRELQKKRAEESQSSKPLFIDTSQAPSHASSSLPAGMAPSGLISMDVASSSPSGPQLSDLEKSASHPSNTKSPSTSVDHGPLTPPHTYENESDLAQLEMWQAHQRPLQRQISDTTYDREKQIISRRHEVTEQAPQMPAYGMGNSIASLPPSGPHSSSHKESSGSSHHHATLLYVSQDHDIQGETLERSHPPPTLPSELAPANVSTAHWLSRDSGYASSLSSTVTGNEPIKTADVFKVVEADGSEITTTTTQCRKKIIHVIPQNVGFDTKQLPALLMEQIRKDESGGLQNRLLGLMKEKGIGEIPMVKQKPVHKCGQRLTDCSKEQTLVHSLLQRGQSDPQEGGGLLKIATLKQLDSSSGSCLQSPQIMFQNRLSSESTQTKSTPSSSFITSCSSSSLLSPLPPDEYTQGDSPACTLPVRMSAYHSLPGSQRVMISSNTHSSLHDPHLNPVSYLHDLSHHSGHFLTAQCDQKTKLSKSSLEQIHSRSLPRNQTFKNYANLQSFSSPKTHSKKSLASAHASCDTPFNHFLPMNKESSRSYDDMHDSEPVISSQFGSRSKPTWTLDHDSPKATFSRSGTIPWSFNQSSRHHSLAKEQRHSHDTIPGVGPHMDAINKNVLSDSSTPQQKHTPLLNVDSELESVDQLKPYMHVAEDDRLPHAEPAPFVDDATLDQPVPSYSWVMERIHALRTASHNQSSSLSRSNKCMHREKQSGPNSVSGRVSTSQVTCKQPLTKEIKSHKTDGITECERVRGRPFTRYRHRSEGGSSNQNHDIWLKREDFDASQKEPRALSADRTRVYVHSSMDYHSQSKRTGPGQQRNGNPMESNNTGTIQAQHQQSRRTNHSHTLTNANHSSGITSGTTQGISSDQTNMNDKTNLMAGLEDAIRMLSELTHIQNRESATVRPPTTRHNKHVIGVHRVGDLHVTGPQRRINLPSGWIGTSAKCHSNTQPRQQVPARSQSGPAKGNQEDKYDKVDLHIDESKIKEPLDLEGKVANRIADFTVKMSHIDQAKRQPPTGPRGKPAKAKQVTRRTPQQSGYDSDSAIHQYYDPPNQRIRETSPERWLHNPGGLPIHESEYWNKMEGLKSPNLKEQWARKPEYDIASSNESLQNGSVTPKFPVGPKAYKNMVSTPIAVVGRPPHGPDAPYPLSPIKYDDRDVLDTNGLHMSPAQHISNHTASAMDVDAPAMTSAQATSPATPEIITVTHKRIVQTDRINDQNGFVQTPIGSRAAMPQQPIVAKVERVATPVSQVEIQAEKKAVQNGQHYPIQAKVERVPMTNYGMHELGSETKPANSQYPAGGFPPSPKKEVTFQDARGGMPERPTSPQALAGTTNSQIFVKETKIVPTLKKPVEVAPTWPIELEVHIKNEGMGPEVSDVHVKGDAFTPQNSPQQLSPSSQDRAPCVQEPTIQQEVVQREQADANFNHQMKNLAIQPPAPQYPTYSDRMKNRPAGPIYPTFSDRHRKAAAGRLEEVPPQIANGYHTMYDNRGAAKPKRASTGSEGVWPVRSHQRKPSDSSTGPTLSGRTTPSNFYLMQYPSPYSSSQSLADTSIDKVRFVKDLSAWWYKPHISRDEAIAMLKDKSPGQFVVRDSNSFPGAFGLAVKVAQLPPNAPPSKKATDPASELVRHFLIEPNPRGVRLKGCANEPIFGSLSALIYQHTLTQLALPCKLQLPESDPAGGDMADSAIDPKSAHALLSQGAACNVLYLGTMEMESLTGPSAVREAVNRLFKLKDKPRRVVVHFKVSLKGITLTDNHRKLFFRKHYPVESVLYCGMDSGSRKWKRKEGSDEAQAKIFGFVGRKPGSKTDNQCHLFAEYEIEQPASAIVSFVTKVLLGSSGNN